MRRNLARKLILALALLTGPSWAEDRDPAVAEALFRAGREATNQGDRETACARFEESYRLDAAVGTLLNLAICEEELGRVARAWEHYRRVADLLEPRDPRQSMVQTRLEKVESRVPRLTLRLSAGSPGETQVIRDGIRVGGSGLNIALPVEPGKHELAVTAPGRETRRYEITLAEGETRTLDLDPGAMRTAKQPTRVAPSGAKRDVVPSYNRTTRDLGYVALGASGAALAATVAMGIGYLATRSRLQDHCPTPKTCDDEGVRAAGTADTLQVAAITAGIAAGALGIAGVGLLVWSAPPSHTSAWVPMGLTLHGVF